MTSTGGTRTEAAVNTYNNETISGVTTVNANTSNIASAVTTAGANSLVVVDGSVGTITIPNLTSINLVNGQTLLGGGSSLLLRGINSGVQAVYYAPGQMPTVTGTGALLHAIIDLADNSVVTGLAASTSSGHGVIRSDNALNFTVSNNTVSGIGATGIVVEGGSGVVENNTITTGTSQHSADIEVLGAGQLTIRNNILTAHDAFPFMVSGYAGAVVATSVQKLTISGNTITTDYKGIFADVSNAPASITGNTILLDVGSGAEGIVVYASP